MKIFFWWEQPSTELGLHRNVVEFQQQMYFKLTHDMFGMMYLDLVLVWKNGMDCMIFPILFQLYY